MNRLTVNPGDAPEVVVARVESWLQQATADELAGAIVGLYMNLSNTAPRLFRTMLRLLALRLAVKVAGEDYVEKGE